MGNLGKFLIILFTNIDLGAQKRLGRPLDKQAIAFKGYKGKGQKEILKAVPNWLDRLREYVDRLISIQNNEF